jgi:hypothetical protein
MYCTFFDATPVEISKLFTTPKDMLNVLSYDYGILEFQKNKDVSAEQFRFYNLKFSVSKEKCLTELFLENISDGHALKELNLTDICLRQKNINIRHNYINLEFGGHIKFFNLIPINTREVIIEWDYSNAKLRL